MNNGALTSIQGLTPSILRALIIGFSYWIVSISLTVLSGSVAAFGGCLAACLLSDRFRSRDSMNRLRTTSLLTLSVALFTFTIFSEHTSHRRTVFAGYRLQHR
jgi:uncharacterized membrane protein